MRGVWITLWLAGCSYGAGGTYANRMKFQAHAHPDARPDIERVFDSSNSDATRAVALCVWSAIEAADHRANHDSPSRLDSVSDTCRQACPKAAAIDTGPLHDLALKYGDMCEGHPAAAAPTAVDSRR